MDNNKRLNPKFVTQDSKKRRLMYLDDIKRKQEEQDYQGPKEEFLASLNMEFIISEAREADLERAEELTVRTHQLNATGKTYDYEELNYFRKSSDHKLFVCELKDNYGSYGKIGLALIKQDKVNWHLELLLMSCRVMSRGVGTVLLTHIMREAKKNKKKLYADFKITDRNRMMYVTYRFANFKEISRSSDNQVLLENDLSQMQEFPPYIKIAIQ